MNILELIVTTKLLCMFNLCAAWFVAVIFPSGDFPAIHTWDMGLDTTPTWSAYEPGLALAAFLLAVAELVVFALALFHVLRRLDAQWLPLLPPRREPAAISPAANPPVAPQDIKPAGDTVRAKSQDVSADGTQGGVFVPRVVVSRHLLAELHEYITGFLREHGEENEAGAVLVGEYHDRNGSPTFRISGFIPAGPKVSFSAGSILFDTEWQTGVLTAIRIKHPSVGNIGMIHRHPGQLDRCSGGDEVADLEAVLESPSKGLVFAIITIGNPKQDPLSVYYKEFKIDVFVMSEGTGFKYAKVKPVFEDIPLVKASPATIALCENGRGPSAFYDFAVLRHLGAKVSVRLIEENGAQAVLCTVSPKDAACDVNVLCKADGALQVLVDESEGPTLEVHGPWEQPETGRHVWLAHLVVTILAQRRWDGNGFREHSGTTMLRHPLLDNKKRLVAEVRAMQQKYGDRAVLKQWGDELGWLYTVRECGRELPIKILYPPDFPASLPRIVSVKNLPSSPHQLGGNELCWANRWSGDTEWNPSRDTAVVCIAAAHRWFACLLVYLTTGNWPKGADV